MTEQQKHLSKRYLYYKLLTNMWFLGAVWLYFYRIYITDQQVGLLDGMAFAIGLIAEIPSGALADKFGRGNMVKLGQFLTASGILIQASTGSFIPFFVGQSILMIGVAFVSGADEALFFSKLKFNRESSDWRKLATRASQVTLFGTLIATTIGGFLHTINPRIPWFLTGGAFLLSIITVWSIKDTRDKKDSQGFGEEMKSYVFDIKTGLSEFRLPKLWIYIPVIFALQGLFYANGYGILRIILLDRFNFSPFIGSLVVASSSLISIALLSYMHKNADKLSEKKVIKSISLLTVAMLIISVFDIGMYGYVVVLALYAGEHILQPFMSETINYHSSEKYRATVLSAASFLKALPYVLLAPIIGFLNDSGSLSYFLVTWSILILGALILYLSRKKKDDKIIIDSL